MPIRITVDVENISGSVVDKSFIDPLTPLLEILANRGVTATFFVVGSLAPVWNMKLKELAQSGHEIGLHGFTHEYLDALGPKKFESELNEGKRILESVIEKEVIGFRAPYFSLTKNSEWAHEILSNSGFKFSSSVLPSWNPQAGFPSAPKSPFRWPSGLIEFPVPTFGFGNLSLPLLGGAYLRLIPSPVFRLARIVGARRTGEWSYCHPYDFDINANYERVRDTSVLFSKLIFARRGLMLDRIEELIEKGSAKSFTDKVGDQEFAASLKTFNV
jgi:polysaccharide deacetylase family protein (PEP-CTERM system associated)